MIWVFYCWIFSRPVWKHTLQISAYESLFYDIDVWQILGFCLCCGPLQYIRSIRAPTFSPKNIKMPFFHPDFSVGKMPYGLCPPPSPRFSKHFTTSAASTNVTSSVIMYFGESIKSLAECLQVIIAYVVLIVTNGCQIHNNTASKFALNSFLFLEHLDILKWLFLFHE